MPTIDSHVAESILLRLCWLATPDREAAADVAQEAMTRAWARWDELSEPGSNPGAWITTVALNLARSRWCRFRRAAEAGRRPVADVQIGVTDPVLLDAIRGLSYGQREAVVLRYWADLNGGDCADDCSVIVCLSSCATRRRIDREPGRVHRSR
ncbi:MAG: hypothetical protein GY939_10815 [Actinomycetia bacterium]|nr:hypothetical protein [Actinomycetes bacterium]